MADNLFESVKNEDAGDESNSSHEDLEKCVQIPWPKNIGGHCGKREEECDIEPEICDRAIVEEACNNYIIAKKILSNLPWQEKSLCKCVCTTWNSAIKALNKEQLSPGDFVIEVSLRNGIKFKKSSIFPTEPLVVFTFANTTGFNVPYKCMTLLPHPCEPPCEQKHCFVDLVQKKVCGPKNCMLTVRSGDLSYLPEPQSPTYKNLIVNKYGRTRPFIGGIYIPVIPDVQFHVINIKSNTDMQNDFFNEVKELSKDRIFKGVLVYVTEKYLLHSVEDFFYLNYFKDVQPDVPYALGGCIVEDAISEKNDIKLIIDSVNDGNDFISENLISIGMFTVPKSIGNAEGDKCNFDMYSFIIESSDWTKAQIQKTINEFSKKVPRFEFSVALKLSCVGRDKKHELEQNYFRAAFPNTRLIGCYGNGELGINHPARPVDDGPPSLKRHRRDPGPQFGIIYSYSTVFVYIGWGKITSS